MRSLWAVLRGKIDRLRIARHRQTQTHRDLDDQRSREHLERLREGINDKWRGAT
jgi:hypothetical protein